MRMPRTRQAVLSATPVSTVLAMFVSVPTTALQEGVETTVLLVTAIGDEEVVHLTSKEGALGVREKRHLDLDLDAIKARSRPPALRSAAHLAVPDRTQSFAADAPVRERCRDAP